jgi:hypothetical protein
MDWTDTRMTTSEGLGTLHLTPSVAGPYSRGDDDVTAFVTRYARAAIARLHLRSVLVTAPDGRVLGEVLPEPPRTPF